MRNCIKQSLIQFGVKSVVRLFEEIEILEGPNRNKTFDFNSETALLVAVSEKKSILQSNFRAF